MSTPALLREVYVSGKRPQRRAGSPRIGGVSRALGRAAAWIDQWLHRVHQRELDAYLSQSTDHADLERRLKAISYGERRVTIG
jgi:hypothetical protein